MLDDRASDHDSQRTKSFEILTRFTRSLSYQDLVKILTPFKYRLLSDETVLFLNQTNFSVEQADCSFTVQDFLDFLGPTWQKWIHASEAELESNYCAPTFDLVKSVGYEGFDNHFDVDVPPTDFLSNFIDKLSKHQKRAILMCARDGFLTDESFLNVSNYNGPDRIQVSMKKVVSVISEQEQRKRGEFSKKGFFVRWLNCCHLSSANFDYTEKADLNIRPLYSSRQKMPIYFTILFALMTILTFASHLWSNITNYVDIQSHSMWLSIAIVIFASLLIGALLYLVTYIVGFLFCCEASLWPLSMSPISRLNRLQLHFFEIHQFECKIYVTKLIQFILLWYTMLLAIYAHQFDLNIYPALSCVLTNGFGLMLFMRIVHFLHACRKGTDKTAGVLYAR